MSARSRNGWITNCRHISGRDRAAEFKSGRRARERRAAAAVAQGLPVRVVCHPTADLLGSMKLNWDDIDPSGEKTLRAIIVTSLQDRPPRGIFSMPGRPNRRIGRTGLRAMQQIRCLSMSSAPTRSSRGSCFIEPSDSANAATCAVSKLHTRGRTGGARRDPL